MYETLCIKELSLKNLALALRRHIGSKDRSLLMVSAGSGLFCMKDYVAYRNNGLMDLRNIAYLGGICCQVRTRGNSYAKMRISRV